jgi:3-oxoacyl-(acyl-carrier-protein) synthase
VCHSLNGKHLKNYLPEVTFHGLRSIGIGYGIKAALDAWTDAGYTVENNETLWDTGCIFGSSVADTDVIKNAIERIDAKESRKLGSRVVEQIMGSGITAYVAGRLGLGNRTISNSAACATGTQAIVMGYEYIRTALPNACWWAAVNMLTNIFSAHLIRCASFPGNLMIIPEAASRPMSSSACGFVPATGAGALMLEDMEYALERNATIYAEIVGGATNSGGQSGWRYHDGTKPAGRDTVYTNCPG